MRAVLQSLDREPGQPMTNRLTSTRRTREIRPHYSSGCRFHTQLQCSVHFLESTTSITVQHFREQRQEQTAETLSLDEPHTPLTQRLDREGMLAVEQPGHPEMTQPTEYRASTPTDRLAYLYPYCSGLDCVDLHDNLPHVI
jgi:hypothetical protein